LRSGRYSGSKIERARRLARSCAVHRRRLTRQQEVRSKTEPLRHRSTSTLLGLHVGPCRQPALAGLSGNAAGGPARTACRGAERCSARRARPRTRASASAGGSRRNRVPNTHSVARPRGRIQPETGPIPAAARPRAGSAQQVPLALQGGEQHPDRGARIRTSTAAWAARIVGARQAPSLSSRKLDAPDFRRKTRSDGVSGSEPGPRIWPGDRPACTARTPAVLLPGTGRASTPGRACSRPSPADQGPALPAGNDPKGIGHRRSAAGSAEVFPAAQRWSLSNHARGGRAGARRVIVKILIRTRRICGAVLRQVPATGHGFWHVRRARTRCPSMLKAASRRAERGFRARSARSGFQVRGRPGVGDRGGLRRTRRVPHQPLRPSARTRDSTGQPLGAPASDTAGPGRNLLEPGGRVHAPGQAGPSGSLGGPWNGTPCASEGADAPISSAARCKDVERTKNTHPDCRGESDYAVDSGRHPP